MIFCMMAEINFDPRVKQILHIAPRLSPNENEKILLKQLLGLVRNMKWTFEDVSVLFDALLNRFESASTNSQSYVLTWMIQMLHCIEINYVTPSWRSKSERTLIQLIRDTTVSDDRLKEFLADDTDKTLDEIIEEIKHEKLNQVDDEMLQQVRDIVSSADQELKSHGAGTQFNGLKKDLLRLCQAAKKTHFRPRLTQMVSWCLMALSDTGRLIQVGTGEGKSCIVAMFAAYRALRGQKVDVMSSSPILAQRDSEEWRKFYEVLGISMDCNVNRDDEDLKKCYKSQVVYGTVQEFAGDWLRHYFQRMDIFGERKLQCAIVDEVDSLMLDKGHHVVYLSSDMAALQHLNPLLAFIWFTVNKYSNIGAHATVLKAVEEEIKQNLHFTPCELNKPEGSCYIPGFLSDLVNAKLNVWIGNAFKAQSMQMDHEYILEKHGIVPVDYSCTGVVENLMKWSDGLQQFLEMKHQSKLSDMTAITNYMSNVGLLQKYKDQIYGMSGTLGQQAEIETLQKIYEGIQSCRIPSYKRRKLFEVEGVFVRDETSWVKKICDIVTEQIQSTSFRGPRAVLIICETIKLAKTLYQAFGKNVPNKKLYISNNMDNREVLTKMLGEGHVVIATNLAGRGTDLKISESVKEAGGLFVIQTFLPKNARVEAQAFGRAARQGSPGSAQLIVCSEHLPEHLQLLLLKRNLLSLMENIISVGSHSLIEDSMSGLMLAKKIRDESVAEELSTYMEYHIPNMKKKEKLFSQYMETLDLLYRKTNNKPAESDVSALNEFWGMWLLTKFSEEDSIDVLTQRLKEDLDKAVQKLRQRQSPLSNLHHYTVYGNELQKNGNLPESINMYTKAIKEDPCWAAVAYYNRAFVSLTQQNKHQDSECINQALKDLQAALRSVELYREQLDITYKYATQQSVNNKTSRFDKHIRTSGTLLKSFKANIIQALQKVEKAASFSGGYLEVWEKNVNFLVPPDQLLSSSIFLMGGLRVLLIGRLARTVGLSYYIDPLVTHQLIMDPSFDIFMELKSLESKGLTRIYVLENVSFLRGFLSKIGDGCTSFFRKIFSLSGGHSPRRS